MKRAEEYYDDNIYLGAYINYHSLWGAYYKLTKEWDKCFREFDLALTACRGSDPLMKTICLKQKQMPLCKQSSIKMLPFCTESQLIEKIPSTKTC